MAATTSHGDFHRSLHCAEWAIRLSAQPAHAAAGRMVREIEEAVAEARAGIGNFEYGVMLGHAFYNEHFPEAEPILDAELGWVDESVRLATAVADVVGWENVPWEQLVDELIAMEPGAPQGS